MRTYCLGRLKLTRQTNGKRNEQRNQREIETSISVSVRFVEPEKT